MILIRAYYALALIDWMLRMTEERGLGENNLGFLYDIGCNIEKGIIKVGPFTWTNIIIKLLT